MMELKEVLKPIIRKLNELESRILYLESKLTSESKPIVKTLGGKRYEKPD